MTRTRLPSLPSISVTELPPKLATNRSVPSEIIASGSLSWYCSLEKTGAIPGSVPGPAGPGMFQVIAVVEAGQPEPAAGTVTVLVDVLTQALTGLAWTEAAPNCGQTGDRVAAGVGDPQVPAERD